MKTRHILCLFLALSLMLFAVSCRKKTPADLLTEAGKAMQRGDLIGATIKAQDLIEKHPNTPEAMRARMLLAYAQSQNGQDEEARATLTEIIKLVGLKSDLGKRAYMARLSTYRQKPEQAIEEIKKTSETLRVAPDLAGGMQMQLGILYMMTKQPEKAKQHFRLMMQNAPTESEVVEPMEQLVRIFLEEKKYQEALDIYQKQLERYPNSEMQGSYLFAVGSMHRQMATAAKDPQVKANEEQAAEEAFLKSENFFEKKIQAEPLERNKNAYTIQLSKVFRGRGETKKADNLLITTMNKTKNKESQLDILRELAQMKSGERDLKAARIWLQRIATKFPGTEDAQGAIAAIRSIDQMLKQGAGATTGTLRQAPIGEAIPTTATKSLDMVTTSAVPAESPAAKTPNAPEGK